METEMYFTKQHDMVWKAVRDFVNKEINRLQELADVNSTACVPGVSESIKEGAHKGAKLLIEIIDDERTDSFMMKLKANVALEFLSRAGYAPIKQVMVESASISYHKAEDIEEMKIKAGLAWLVSVILNWMWSNKKNLASHYQLF